MYRGSPDIRTPEGAPARAGQRRIPSALQPPGPAELFFGRSQRPSSIRARVGASGAVLLVGRCSVALDCFGAAAIEEFAQLVGAEQFPQLRLVDDERLGPPLGERRVPVVQEAGDVAEKQRRRERGRPFRVDGDNAYLPAPEIREGRDERGHVEEVAETLAICLEQYRERPVS